MAKFLSHVFTDLRGSVGDTTYSRGRNGLYARKKTVPTQPRSTAQRQVHARFTAITQGYRALSDAQQAAWRALGAQMSRTDSLGIAYTLTGGQAYASVNGLLGTLGTAPVSDAPAEAATAPPLPAVTLTANRSGTPTGALAMPLTAATAYNGVNVQVYATPPLSAGVHFISDGIYRLIEVAVNLPAAPLDLASAYAAKFGSPPVGSRVAVKLVPVTATGFAGSPVEMDTIVTLDA